MSTDIKSERRLLRIKRYEKVKIEEVNKPKARKLWQIKRYEKTPKIKDMPVCYDLIIQETKDDGDAKL
jgi:hypothetical protein